MEILPLSLTQAELKLNRSSTDKRIERRKPNWTECENVFLLDQFSIHREILTCKATDASTNLRKQEVWRIICQNLNKQNVQVRRTPAEVRRKWKNLVTAAKKEVWEIRHQAHVTGASRKLSELSQRVLQLHSTTASAVALFMSGTRDPQLQNGGGNEDSSNGGGRYFASAAPDFEKNGIIVNGYFGAGGGGNGLSAHFSPIVQFSESVSSRNGSVSSGESRDEFDSRIYEEAHDLRVNKNMSMNMNLGIMKLERNTSETTEEIILKPNDDLMKVKLELQIEVFRLMKMKLEVEIRRLQRNPALVWRKRRRSALFKKLYKSNNKIC